MISYSLHLTIGRGESYTRLDVKQAVPLMNSLRSEDVAGKLGSSDSAALTHAQMWVLG